MVGLEHIADTQAAHHDARGVEGTEDPAEGRGATIGFPTANVDPENEVLPGPGVYAGRLRFLDGGDPAEGAVWPAVTNVGTRPTFVDEREVVAEAHLLDFEGDVYGRRVELSFEHHLRPERRFDGVDALREQIGVDVAEGRRRLEQS